MSLQHTMHDTSPRQALLRLLGRRGSASIKDLELALGVTATAVREQVTHLVAEGVVIARLVRGEVGRPYYTYSLTPQGHELFPKDYGQLARLLLETVLDLDGPDKLQLILDGVGARLAAQYEGELRGQELEERLRALAALLVGRGQGADVYPAAAGEGFVLHAASCPYYAVVQDHREICSMEQQMLATVLGAEVTLGDCILDGHRGCQFHVAPVHHEQVPAEVG